ncbi:MULTISPECIES: glutathione S-transferase family protein [unclassified Pseudoalteromonas]|uniref:glutathione S-transferase family protein n=1 Tax=unclassified Pseudoalteromonas TaxID=194690 RepID=UPI001F1700B8|nr:glutathione S-transferase [Pseudoalteromonas sp. L21]MCF7518250.1 glutathione S-transferase [Pseudoalteromonas sp. L21]
MIKLHHLNKSRSKRIIWLLEELGIDYDLVAYQRNPETFLAPDELKEIHPLGKAPVIEDNGKVITESGAITDYLITTYGKGKYMPEPQSDSYVSYQQWLHFAESSAMVPFLLKLFITKDGCKTNFIGDYADNEIGKILSYVNQQLKGKQYLVDDTLTGADFMMSFVVEKADEAGLLAHFPEIKRYLEQLKTHESYHTANDLETKYD